MTNTLPVVPSQAEQVIKYVNAVDDYKTINLTATGI
jgi:hypothetical protein